MGILMLRTHAISVHTYVNDNKLHFDFESS